MPISGGALRTAWLANSPQLVLSLWSHPLNKICTFLASVEEWDEFACTRKGMRVSRPTAEQRRTYFLQPPYKWAIPLMVTSATLHWLLSQSFFLVRVDFFERNSNRASEGKSKSACGYSSLSLLILFIVSFVLMSAISWAISRRMQQRIPNAESCSLVISAACHPIKSEVDAHLEQVKWVVV
jgi:hypothetical protein